MFNHTVLLTFRSNIKNQYTNSTKRNLNFRNINIKKIIYSTNAVRTNNFFFFFTIFLLIHNFKKLSIFFLHLSTKIKKKKKKNIIVITRGPNKNKLSRDLLNFSNRTVEIKLIFTSKINTFYNCASLYLFAHPYFFLNTPTIFLQTFSYKLPIKLNSFLTIF